MNSEKPKMPEGPDRLDIEVQIDEVMAAFAAEEPRRVNAKSVRWALDVPRPSRMPQWFLAAAAVLVVGMALAWRGRGPVSVRPLPITQSSPMPESVQSEASPAASGTSTSTSTSTMATRLADRPKAPMARPATAMSEPYEGLPRIVIVSLESPEPLVAETLDSETIVIPPIQIAPLSVPTLSAGPESHQEKPQP